MMKKIIKAILIALFFFVMLCGTAYAEDKKVNEYKSIFYNATSKDYEALEQVVYWESARAGCGFEVNVATAETVLNRVLSSDWSDTIYDVCHQRNQFVCKALPKDISWQTSEEISDAIEFIYHEGRTVLPSVNYCFFATKKQSCACNHIWVGERKADGKPKKGKGMYFGEVKK